jgi:hypothetical protein
MINFLQENLKKDKIEFNVCSRTKQIEKNSSIIKFVKYSILPYFHKNIQCSWIKIKIHTCLVPFLPPFVKILNK